jgi:hypothetical protein
MGGSERSGRDELLMEMRVCSETGIIGRSMDCSVLDIVK